MLEKYIKIRNSVKSAKPNLEITRLYVSRSAFVAKFQGKKKRFRQNKTENISR